MRSTQKGGVRAALYIVTGPTGKRYVGITTKSVTARWTQHVIDAGRDRWKSALHDAIRKYGRDAFLVEQLDIFTSWEEACSAEVSAIASYGTFGDNGYNLTRGGDGKLGCKHTDDFKERIGSLHTGKIVAESTRDRLRLAHQRRTPEQRAALAAKMAAANARRTPEERARISEAISASKRGKPRSPEVIARISESRRRGEAQRRDPK